MLQGRAKLDVRSTRSYGSVNVDRREEKHASISSNMMKSDEGNTSRKKRMSKYICCASVFMLLVIIGVIVAVLHHKFVAGNALRKKDGVDINFGTVGWSLPSVELLGRGYNVFRGKGYSNEPNVIRDIGRFTYATSQSVGVGTQLYNLPDQVTITQEPTCKYSSVSNSLSESSSTDSMNAAALSFSIGYQQTTDVEVEIPLDAVTAKASTQVRNALTYGYAKESERRAGYAAEGYKYSATYQQNAEVYVLTMDWKQSQHPFSFSQSFTQAIHHIASISSSRQDLINIAVMQFFEQFGSHVLDTASFGARCHQDIMINTNGKTMTSADANTVKHSLEATFSNVGGGFQKGDSAAKNIANTQSISYKTGSIQCNGYVEINVCDSSRTAQVTTPVMLDRIGIPIWKVVAPGVNDAVQQKFQSVVNALVTAGKQCSQNRCTNAGVCLLSDRFWSDLMSGSWNGAFTETLFHKCVPLPIPLTASKVGGFLMQGSGMYVGDVSYRKEAKTIEHPGLTLTSDCLCSKFIKNGIPGTDLCDLFGMNSWNTHNLFRVILHMNCSLAMYDETGNLLFLDEQAAGAPNCRLSENWSPTRGNTGLDVTDSTNKLLWSTWRYNPDNPNGATFYTAQQKLYCFGKSGPESCLTSSGWKAGFKFMVEASNVVYLKIKDMKSRKECNVYESRVPTFKVMSDTNVRLTLTRTCRLIIEDLVGNELGVIFNGPPANKLPCHLFADLSEGTGIWSLVLIGSDGFVVKRFGKKCI